MKLKLPIILLFAIIHSNLWSLPAHKKDTVYVTKGQTINSNINILLGLATKVYYKTPEKSLQYAQAALEIAKNKKDKISEAKVLSTIGEIYQKLDYDKLALPYFAQAYSIATDLENLPDKAEYAMYVGDIYYKLHVIDSANRYYHESFIIFYKLKNEKGLAEAYLRLGNANWYTANYDKALDNYLKSLSLYNKLKYTPGIARIYNNIGSLYTILDDNKSAMINFKKSLQYFKDYDDPRSLSELYFRLGFAYEKNKQYDTAFYYFDWAKTLFDSLHLEKKTAAVDQFISSIYYNQGRHNDAIKLAEKSLGIFEKYDNKWGIAEVSNNLAIFYMKVEDYSKALDFLNHALKLAKEINSIELLRNTYLNFSKYYKENEKYKSALNYYTLYQELNDSVLNKEKAKRIAELQSQFEAESQLRELQKKDEELSRNNELIKRQRRNLYIFGGCIVIILFMSFGLYRQYRMLEVKRRNIELINEELDQRIKERTTALRLTQFSIDQAADPIFWIEAGGQFIYVNRAACRYLEFSKSELLTKNITSLIPRFTAPDWVDIWDIIKTEGVLVIESQFNKKDNTKIPVEISFNYVFHEEKEYAFAFIRDIADRKLKEANLRKAKEKAEEADKLKSAFLANMSHEIRTPMNAIIGFSDLMLQDDTSKEEKHEFANIIKSSGDTLLKLIDDIIDISLIEAGQLKMNLKMFNLNSILKEINRFYQEEKIRLNKKHIEIRLNELNFDNQIHITTDKIRFRQIITNLVGNALKFTDKGYIEIGYRQDKPGIIKIYVKDTGIGIPEDKLAIIFDRFIKVSDEKKLYGGTGLGLAISKKLAEQMGGNLEAISEFGSGSEFTLTISYEMNEISLETELPVMRMNAKYDWDKKSVLIVEDVDSNYYLLETFLKKTGIKIHWAKDGHEAIKYCRKHIPDAVLMDIQLPSIDGYEVTRRILSKYPNIPIIAQTAYAIVGEKDKLFEAGCVDYITKPIDSHILYEVMNKYLG